jgi:hypothetical protein
MDGFTEVKPQSFVSDEKVAIVRYGNKHEFYVKIHPTRSGKWFVGVYDELYEDLYSERWLDGRDEAEVYAQSLVGKVPEDF